MFPRIYFVVSAATLRIGTVKICADGMSTFLESVAVVELNSPAFFSKWTLNMVSTLFFTVASGINFSNTAPETKHRQERLRQRSPLDD
jgi:hypothetical protein